MSLADIKDVCDMRTKYNLSCRSCIYYGDDCYKKIDHNKRHNTKKKLKVMEEKQNGNYKI